MQCSNSITYGTIFLLTYAMPQSLSVKVKIAKFLFKNALVSLGNTAFPRVFSHVCSPGHRKQQVPAPCVGDAQLRGAAPKASLLPSSLGTLRWFQSSSAPQELSQLPGSFSLLCAVQSAKLSLSQNAKLLLSRAVPLAGWREDGVASLICESCSELAGPGAGSSWRVLSSFSRFLWRCSSCHLCVR